MNTDSSVETVTLWRPTGPQELALVEASGWREWPPRLPEQPIFYPVLNEEYATMMNANIVGRIEATAEYHEETRA